MNPRAKIVSLRIAPTMLIGATGGFDVYWDVQTVGFTPKFQLQMADTEAGPWTSLLGSTTSAYLMTGVGPKRLSYQLDIFFRLLVINETPNPAVTVLTGDPSFASFRQNQHEALNYREMLRRENLGLDRYNGEPGVILRRIVYGTRCTDCTDETLGGPVSSECASCFGTGFTGGYYPGVNVFTDLADTASSPDNTALTPNGPAEVKPCEAVFPAYPMVKFKDLYVDSSTNQRYEIQSATADEYRGNNIRQIVVLSRLQPSDAAYQVPLP
jgi:hypothetical protein